MDLATCVQRLRAPNYARGHKVAEGMFFRNMEPNIVTKRYAQDGDPATYGYRLRQEKWRWRDTDGDGLSVNSKDCVGCVECSICISPNPSRFAHVVELDLRALADELEIELVAIYDPVEPPNANPCHYNIFPTSVAYDEFLVKLKSFVTRLFPKQFPGNDPKLRAQALAAKDQADRVFLLFRNVSARLPNTVIDSSTQMQSLQVEPAAAVVDVVSGEVVVGQR